MNGSLLVILMLCASPVQTFGNITIVNKVPSYCDKVLGWPVSYDEIHTSSITPKPEVKPPAKKKVVKKKRPRGSCKPGRTRNSKGICGRWKR